MLTFMVFDHIFHCFLVQNVGLGDSGAVQLGDDVRLFLGPNQRDNLRTLQRFMSTRDELCQDASAAVQKR